MSGSGSGSGKNKNPATNTGEYRASSSGDNTYVDPKTIEETLARIKAQIAELTDRPDVLKHRLDLEFSPFRITAKLPENIKKQILAEAKTISPLVQDIHDQLPHKVSLVDYWNYKIVNAKVILHINIVDILLRKDENNKFIHVTDLADRAQLESHRGSSNGMNDFVTPDTPSDVE